MTLLELIGGTILTLYQIYNVFDVSNLVIYYDKVVFKEDKITKLDTIHDLIKQIIILFLIQLIWWL